MMIPMAASSFTIRPGYPSDAGVLSDLAVRAKATWGYPSDWLEEWAPQLRFTEATFRRCAVFVAEEGGRISGVVALASGPSTGAGEIEHLWVDPDVQNQGVGRALVAACLAAAREAGVTWIRIESDPGARPFYERLGAVYEGEVPAPIRDRRDRTLPVLRLEVAE